MQLRARSDVIQRLQERIDGMERSRLSVADRCGISTGFPDLDRLLADGGLRRGTLVEWLSDTPGSGAATLALCVAARILREEGAFVVIDKAGVGEFYPPAAADLGIPLDRTAIVRPESTTTGLWAWEQSLRCPGVAVTFGRIDKLDNRRFRRLQLAAEAGEGFGFLIRPPGYRAGASWAATCIRVRPSVDVRSANVGGGFGLRGESMYAANYVRGANVHIGSEREDFARRLRVSVTRGHSSTREIDLELPHETNDVPMASELAGAVADAG